MVFTIGLSLYPIAINYMAGGVNSPTYASMQNWAVAAITLVVVIGLSQFAKGYAKLSNIFGNYSWILCIFSSGYNKF